MKLTEVTYDSAVPIDGYGPGFFRVAGEVIHGAMLVTGSRAISWGGYDDLAALEALSGEIDVIFLGTGAETAHVPGPVRAAVERSGMGIEPMASPAACRTYNVLLSEGRRVALAALPV
ncbi:Mth938-like domain-containing protein [Aliiroseovarius sp.]|uniref:Mth938-like domain-containing protein n=1 Tax=Aliiroseovarius sp. TaxID=1872442 RepID=UPI00261D3AFD|nr:Mth938-like domain-containing protein [Aliiroseovarius sp.]